MVPPPHCVPDLTAIAEWQAECAKNINVWDHNLIALGDFNINRKGDALYDAFTSTGLSIPDDLHTVLGTFFGKSGEGNSMTWLPGSQG